MRDMKQVYKEFWATVTPDLDPRFHDWGHRRIPTNDNWCGTFEDGTVSGSVCVLSSGELRVCFWGNDDAGLELDMPLTSEDYRMWNTWLSNLSFVSMEMLIGLGFTWA